MKTSAIVRIVLFSILIVILVSVLLGAVVFHSLRFDDTSIHTDTNVVPLEPSGSASYNLPAAGIADLEIHWVAGSIQVVYAQDDQISIRETSGEKLPMAVRKNGSKLIVDFCERKFPNIHADNYRKDLTIAIPRNWTPGELDIETVSADLDVSGLALQKLEVDSVSAVCTLTDCTAEEFSVDTVSGDIHFSGALNDFSCSAVSGSCTAKLTNTPRKIEMSGLSGDLALTLPEDSGFRVKLESATGGFFSDFPVTKTDRDYLFGDGRCQIEIEGLSGNVSIHKAS